MKTATATVMCQTCQRATATIAIRKLRLCLTCNRDSLEKIAKDRPLAPRRAAARDAADRRAGGDAFDIALEREPSYHARLAVGFAMLRGEPIDRLA